MKLDSPTKMTFPGPPRKNLLRFIFVAVSVLLLLYFFRNSSLRDAFELSSPVAEAPASAVEPPQSNPISYEPSTPTPTPEPKQEEKPEQKQEQEQKPKQPEEKPATPQPSRHPIDKLIEDAEKEFQGLMAKESHDINAAAAEYRKRRGRHPPPGFDAWFKFAQEHKAVMVEEFFDQIYHDIGPFWGLAPKQMRREASNYEMTIKIRNGTATAGSDWFWTKIWLKLVKTIEGHLPDMDIALNAMDEPRILAPWEDVNGYMDKERASRVMAPPNEVISQYQTLDEKPDKDVEPRKMNWEKEKPFWKLAIQGCRPDSLARNAVQVTDFSHTPDISLKFAEPHLYKGYVQNFTRSTDFCNQPDIQSLHGMMINPLSVATSKTLFPMFGGSKLPTNNEILLPAPMYWNNEARFSGGDNHGPPWAQKQNKVIWRGVATGGKNKADNWKGFQRHRFISQSNGTEISNVENWKQVPQNWAMPTSQYDLAAKEEGRLGEWTKEWSDTGFVDLMCAKEEPKGRCNYTGDYFKILKGVTMANQFDCKYLPDIDGNSFSGRYRGFLMSTSLPIKATIFREWHDSRLVPWKHFVPMDNRFMDFWGIMQYFLGYNGKELKVENHDKEAAKIASEGQDWANRVLRPDDMQIYVFRVLLEYARVTNDNREKMGWVGDLLQ